MPISPSHFVSWIFFTHTIIHTSSQNYIHDGTSLVWADADALCVFSYGTSLASIHNSTQNDEAKSLCTYCWIGASDQDTEAIWTWSDDTPFDYGTDISGGVYPWYNTGGQEPNNEGTGEDCVAVQGSARNWNDNPCDFIFSTLCNYPCSITIVNDNINNIRQPMTGNIIGYMDILDEVYVSFDFIIYTYTFQGNGFDNILQIGTEMIDRYPAIFINGPDQRLHASFSRINSWNPAFNYVPVLLNRWYHFELHATQTSLLALLDNVSICDEIGLDSHLIKLNQPIYISNGPDNGNNVPLDGRIRDLKISTNNAYLSPFNYLCDYNNTFTVIKGNWSIDNATCQLTQYDDDPTGTANVIWLGGSGSSLLWTDYKIEFILNIQSGAVDAQGGLLYRAQNVSVTNDGGQQYYVDVRNQQGIRLSRFDNAWIPIYIYSMIPNFNQDYLIRVELVGYTHKIYLDNKLIFTQTNNAYASGSVGFRTYRASVIFKKLRIIFPDNNNWISFAPTPAPTTDPTKSPTNAPSKPPTNAPTDNPTTTPTLAPSFNPSAAPSLTPTITPSTAPSSPPTVAPSFSPSALPTNAPTRNPSLSPTHPPTTKAPTLKLVRFPTISPTLRPVISTFIISTTEFVEDDELERNNQNSLLLGLDLYIILTIISVLSCILIVLMFWWLYFKRKRQLKRKELKQNSSSVNGVANGVNSNVNGVNIQMTSRINKMLPMQHIKNSSISVETPMDINMTSSQLRMTDLPLPNEGEEDNGRYDENIADKNKMVTLHTPNKSDDIGSSQNNEDDDDAMYRQSEDVTDGEITTAGSIPITLY